MEKKKVIIVDDEPDARRLLRQYLGTYNDVDIIHESSDGNDAVRSIDELKPDWVFLDIQMPGLNGFEVLQRIKHIPRIIFSTAYDSFALDAFDNNAIDYLLKPYSLQRFSNTINKLKTGGDNYGSLSKLHDSLKPAGTYPQHFLLYFKKKLIRISVNDIAWFEANGDYTKAHVADRFYLSHLGIGALEQKLNPALFIRIHRSAIINIHFVKEVFRNNNGYHIILVNEIVHKVGRAYLDAIKQLKL